MPKSKRKTVKTKILNYRWGFPIDSEHWNNLQIGQDPTTVDQVLLENAINTMGDLDFDTREIVKDKINIIITFHRVFQEQEKDPPRPAAIRSNLTCILQAADLLRSQLVSLDYWSLKALRDNNAFEHTCLRVPIDIGRHTRGDEFRDIGQGIGSRLISVLEMIAT